jgi:hypothetical protein
LRYVSSSCLHPFAPVRVWPVRTGSAMGEPAPRQRQNRVLLTASEQPCTNEVLSSFRLLGGGTAQVGRAKSPSGLPRWEADAGESEIPPGFLGGPASAGSGETLRSKRKGGLQAMGSDVRGARPGFPDGD